MKKIYLILAFISAFALAACSSICDNDCQKKGDRKIAVQTYTFNKYTLEETLDMLEKTDVRALEMWNGQKISSKYPGIKFNPFSMTEDHKKWVKDMLNKKGFKGIGYGVIGMKGAKTEKEIVEIFEFAKYFEIPLINTEAPKELLPVWQKYCKQYGIKMSIHNHEKGSGNDYYDPNIVMELINPYSEIGACPDNGAWSRSGNDIIDCFKIMQGKIMLVHFKDQEKFNSRKSKAKIYGTGALDMKSILAELDRQGYEGYYVIEHGDDQDKIMTVVEADIEFLKNN